MDNGNVVYDGEEMESFAQIAQGHINGTPFSKALFSWEFH